MTQSTQPAALVPSPVWTDDSLQLGDTVSSYRSAGQGDVLLVVGGAVTPALDLLAARFRVVLADLGAGDSPRAAAARVVAFAAALGVDSPALLATGADAAAALWAAVEHPELVRTLVLEAPTFFADAGPADPELAAAMPLCQVPTLVLLGQRDPAAGPRFAGDYKSLPASSVAIVYAAEADIQGQRPAAFADTVADYLHRGQAFVLSTASTLIHA